jgi:cation transport regulator ChaC
MPEPVCYIFGYGSLINPESVAKTLREPVDVAAIQPAVLRDYQRSWSLEETVLLNGKEEQQVTMVFLNIRSRKGTACNGVIFPVSERSLCDFDQRERRYDRIEIGHLLSPKVELPVYTYVGKEPYVTPPESAVVAERYEKLVEDGLAHWGDAFCSEFHESTVPHRFERTAEPYTFA